MRIPGLTMGNEALARAVRTVEGFVLTKPEANWWRNVLPDLRPSSDQEVASKVKNALLAYQERPGSSSSLAGGLGGQLGSAASRLELFRKLDASDVLKLTGGEVRWWRGLMPAYRDLSDDQINTRVMAATLANGARAGVDYRLTVGEVERQIRNTPFVAGPRAAWRKDSIDLSLPARQGSR